MSLLQKAWERLRLKHFTPAGNRTFLIIALCSLLLPLPFHFRHDHIAFTAQWLHEIGGGNPWLFADGSPTTNTYGPLFNAFAPLYAVYTHLPHLVMITAWLLLSRLTFNAYSEAQSLELNPKVMSRKWKLFGLIFLNPFFLITVVSYGHFDIIVASFSVLSLLALQKQREWRAGLWIGIAILFKFYPIFLVPFFAIGRIEKSASIRFRFLAGLVLTLLIGFALGYWIWGSSVFLPLQIAKDRESTMLSIFRFLRSEYSPLKSIAPSFNFLSPYLLLSSLGIVGLTHLKNCVDRQSDSLLAAILGFFVTLMFYRVGHPQFYTVLFFLVPLWWAQEARAGRKVEPKLAVAMLLPLLYVSFAKFLYILTQGYKFQWVWIDKTISVPFFMIQVYGYLTLYFAVAKRRPLKSRAFDSSPVHKSL